MTPLHVVLPLRLISEPNARQHWAAKASRTKQQRGLVRLRFGTGIRHRLPCQVRIVRIAPAELDGDNLRAACKAVRDGVADAIGTNDRDRAIEWVYGQRRPMEHEMKPGSDLLPVRTPTGRWSWYGVEIWVT